MVVPPFNFLKNLLGSFKMKLKNYLLTAMAIMILAGMGAAHASDFSDLIDKADTAFIAYDYKTAVELYKEGLQIDPTDYMVWTNLGFSLSELKRYDESLMCYKKAVELGAPFSEGSAISDKARELYYSGNSYQNSGEYKKAIEFYSQANKKDPNNGTILQAMGWSYKKDGDHISAEKVFKNAIRVEPLYSYPYGSLGYIYYDSNSLLEWKHFYSVMLIIGIDNLEIKNEITERLKECEKVLSE
jgi:tetratricopeptide (TPR) repeat protein